jgi:hypothetical protein
LTISTEMKEALYLEETEEAFIMLLTITHSTLPEPIRVAANGEDVVSRGMTFMNFPFDATLASDDAKTAPRARIVINNVDRTIITSLKSINSPPSINMEIIRSSAPDTVEMEMDGFKLALVDYNAVQISGDLILEDLTHEPYPAGTFNPSKFPGGF